MSRAPGQSLRPLLAAATALLVLSLLPASWLRWLNDVAAVVNLPLAPVADLGNDVRAWLRPGAAPRTPEPDELELLEKDRDEYRALWNAERLRVEELLGLLEDFRLAQQFDRGSRFEPLRAEVVGRGPDRLAGPVRLNVGGRHGVRPGDVAVFGGAHLVGRVTEEVSAMSCLLTPIVDPALGRLHAAILPDPEPANPSPAAIRLLVTPTGDGLLTADADAEARIEVGDPVVLDDPAWPETARGMILGLVESVERRDDQPLRSRLIIRPRHDLHALRTVVVKVEPARAREGAAGDNGPGGGGAGR